MFNPISRCTPSPTSNQPNNQANGIDTPVSNPQTYIPKKVPGAPNEGFHGKSLIAFNITKQQPDNTENNPEVKLSCLIAEIKNKQVLGEHEKSILKLYELFIKTGDVNVTDICISIKRPLLPLAILTKNVAMVKVLLELGADTHAKNTPSDSFLFLACESKNPDIIKLLLDNHADINIGYFGSSMTPAVFCAENNLINELKILIDYGADIHAIDAYGENILFRAIGLNGMESAKLLIDLGINLDINNNHNLTALHRTIMYNRNIEAFKFLLRTGINPTVEDFVSDYGEEKLSFLLEFLLFKLEQNNNTLPLDQETLDFVQEISKIDSFIKELQKEVVDTDKFIQKHKVDNIPDIKTKVLFMLRRVGCINKSEHINTIIEIFGYDLLSSKTLQETCKDVIRDAVKNKDNVNSLPLPNGLKNELTGNTGE